MRGRQTVVTTLQTRPATRASAGPTQSRAHRQGYHAEILLVSFAALIIEVCFTRVISYKLFYYYTYLIIGLALLGIGTGGVMVAVSGRLRRARTDTVLFWSFLLGAVGVVASYVVVAYTSLDSLDIWRYGTWASAKSMGELLAICFCIFVPFVAPGMIISTLFGRRPEGVGSLYFADLAGAGLACAIVIYLTATIGPPAAIMLAAAVMLLGATIVTGRMRPLAVPVVVVRPRSRSSSWPTQPAARPASRHEQGEYHHREVVYSAWSPIFRVDVIQYDGVRGCCSTTASSARPSTDGTASSPASLTRLRPDPAAIPFADDGTTAPRARPSSAPPAGHEVLASL